MVKYDTSKFHGVFVALNASYDANGELNTEKLKELALWYHSLGVKGLYVCGSTGEGMLLTAEERKASVKAVCEAVGGKLVILCHVGAPSTRQAVELAKHAESCGVDAVSAVPCVFYIHSEDGSVKADCGFCRNHFDFEDEKAFVACPLLRSAGHCCPLRAEPA